MIVQFFARGKGGGEGRLTTYLAKTAPERMQHYCAATPMKLRPSLTAANMPKIYIGLPEL